MTAPRGGLVETLAGARRALVLRMAEIERFEDRHGGIFAAWDGFQGRAVPPTSAQVRDLVALGLVGGGLPDTEADAVLARLGPDQLLVLFNLDRALVGVAFMPDLAEADEDAPDPPEDGPQKKT